MLFSILQSLVVAKLIYSLPWNGPQRTDLAQETRTANWSPVPTIDIKAKISFRELLHRDIYPVSVCGWIAGNPQLQALCSTRSSCAWNSEYWIVGCCATASDECKFYTSCLDFNSPEPIGNRDDVFTCKGTSVCYSNKYPNGYSQWGCGSSEWATSVWTAFPGMGAKSLQLLTMGTAGKTTKIMSELTSGQTLLTKSSTVQDAVMVAGISGASPPNHTHSLTTSAESDSLSTTSKDKLSIKNIVPAGPIAGGIVAGIALLSGLLGLGLLSHRKGWLKQRQSDDAASTKPPEATTSPQPLEGTVNLDSTPIFELDGTRNSQAISPRAKRDDPDSVGRMQGDSVGEEKGSTQFSEISRFSELPTSPG